MCSTVSLTANSGTSPKIAMKVRRAPALPPVPVTEVCLCTRLWWFVQLPFCCIFPAPQHIKISLLRLTCVFMYVYHFLRSDEATASATQRPVFCFHSTFYATGAGCFFTLFMDKEGEESGNNAAGLEMPKYGISFCAYAFNNWLQMRLYDDGDVFYTASKPVGSVAGNLLYCGTPNSQPTFISSIRRVILLLKFCS